MAKSRLFACGYLDESFKYYFDDIKLADYLLGPAKELFAQAIKDVPRFEKTVIFDGTHRTLAAEAGVDFDVLDSDEQERVILLDKQLRATWPHKQLNEQDCEVEDLPTRQQLIEMLRAYSARERKQLWEMMSDELREQVKSSRNEVMSDVSEYKRSHTH